MSDTVAKQEVARILALPLKDVHAYQNAWRSWTVILRRHVDAPKLKPPQGALLEALHRGASPYGAFGSLGVGAGKTLVLLLAATIVPCERPVALVPAGLDVELKRQYDIWAPHYHVTLPRVVTYSQLSQPKNSTLLDEIRPDLLLVDECHLLRHEGSARSKRFGRYLRDDHRIWNAQKKAFDEGAGPAPTHKRCRALLMSGTITDGDLKHYQHLLFYALRDRSPGPLPAREIERWGAVIDVDGTYTRQDAAILQPIRDWSQQDDWEVAYYVRMSSAPGVVCTKNASVNASIHIRFIRLGVPETITKPLDVLRETWELPDGTQVAEAAEMARHAKSMSVGYYYDLEDPPSLEWATARRIWGRELRTLLMYRSRKGFDSPKVIEDALRKTTYSGYEDAKRALFEWDKYRHMERAPHDTVWLDKDYLKSIVEAWVTKNPRGLIWYQSEAVGTFLKGLGYDVRGAGDDAPQGGPGEEIVCLELRRFQAGFNLQQYDRCFLIEPTPSSSAVQQFIGRIHREGQKADCVFIDILASTQVQRRCISKALKMAASVQRKTGEPQKFLFADKEWVDEI